MHITPVSYLSLSSSLQARTVHVWLDGQLVSPPPGLLLRKGAPSLFPEETRQTLNLCHLSLEREREKCM